jgi:hypothetical protein
MVVKYMSLINVINYRIVIKIRLKTRASIELANLLKDLGSVFILNSNVNDVNCFLCITSSIFQSCVSSRMLGCWSISILQGLL